MMSGNAQLAAMRIADPIRWQRRIETALRTNYGIIQNAAVALGVHRNTLQRWLDSTPQLRHVVEEAKAQAALDEVRNGT